MKVNSSIPKSSLTPNNNVENFLMKAQLSFENAILTREQNEKMMTASYSVVPSTTIVKLIA
jgi:hypothetical protein